MAAKRELLLDLLARDKTAAATKSAAKNIDNVGDAAKDAGDKTEKLGKTTVIAGGEVDAMGNQVKDAARDIAKLDREIALATAELKVLARSFADTSDAAERLDISKAIRRGEADIRRMSKAKGLIDVILPDPEPAAKSFMSKLGGALSSAGDSVAGLAGNHVGVTIGGAIGAAAAPVLVSTIGSAISAGAGAGVLGLGVALAAHDNDVKVAAGRLGKGFLDGIQGEAVKAFKGPVLESLNKFQAAGERSTAKLGKAFQALAPQLDPLTDKLIIAGERLEDAFIGAAVKSGPALQGLGDSIVLLSNGVGDFIDIVSDGGPEAASNLRLIAGATADVIKQTGTFLGALNKLSNNEWITGPLLPLLRKHYDDAAKAATAAEAAQGKLPPTLDELSNATVELNNAMQEQAQWQQTVLANNRSLYGSQVDVAEATAATSATIKENGKGLDLNTEKGRENRRALDQLAGALAANYTGYVEVNGAGYQANELLKRNRDAFIRAAEAAGYSAGKARELANSLLGIPKNIQPKVILSTNAPTKVKQVKALLAGIHNKTVSVSVLVNASRLDKVMNTLDRFGGALAEGGPVRKGEAYVVGDGGVPEVFVPDRNGTVIPSISEYMGMSAGSAGTGNRSTAAAGPSRQRIEIEVVGERVMVELFRRLIRTANLLQD